MKVKVDYRLGGKPRYYAADEGDCQTMQVPDEIRKSVAFVCYEDDTNIKLAGTAFFVAIKRGDLYFEYAVTAKHVIVGVELNSKNDKVFLRVNTRSGATENIETRVNQWRYSDDSSVDVAVIHLELPKGIDYLTIPVDMAATDEVITREAIGVGDDVFLTGLFSNHYGNNRNLPIVRVGNIALMPEERVYTHEYGLIEAYLIEARSIGGLSGSPVFVYLGVSRQFGSTVSMGGRPTFFWLGLMHGHWSLEASDSDDLTIDALNRESVNMGIAIVVPAAKILEVLNQTELVRERERKEKAYYESRSPTADNAE